MAAATALVLMSLLAACTSEGNADGLAAESSTPVVESKTVTLTPKTSMSVSTSTAQSSAVAKALAAQDLLLSTGQLLGMGWKPNSDTDPEATEPQEATQPECSNQSWTLRTGNMTDNAGAAWSFDAAAETETISSQAFVYTDAAAAATALASYRDLAGRCTNWQVGLTDKGYTYVEEQELFDAPVGEESVARQGGTSHVHYTDLPTFRMYWVTSRVGQSIVQVTYFPGSLLGTNQGREQALKLASAAVSNLEKR